MAEVVGFSISKLTHSRFVTALYRAVTTDAKWGARIDRTTVVMHEHYVKTLMRRKVQREPVSITAGYAKIYGNEYTRHNEATFIMLKVRPGSRAEG